MAHPGGRPTKYNPDYCQRAIDLLKEGADIAELAYEFDVVQSTIYEWAKNNKEFSEAIKIGRDVAEGWWKKTGRTNIYNKEFNTALWYINMKNRYGWADKKEISQDVNVTSKEAKEIQEARQAYKESFKKEY